MYDDDPDTNIDDYDTITDLANTDTQSIGSSAQNSQTQVVTFTPAVSGEYTVTVWSAVFYCNVYVIDPRSVTPVTYGVDHKCALGGSMDVSLDIQLDAGVPYLIIMSPEAPELIEDGDLCLTSVVKKED